tara:strand:+ start:477 stop:959 length:483 start_codon:yes stop_codon:yes gene_type:complete
MPNWCSNQATIHGTKEQILELAGAYERGAVIQNYLPVPEDVEDKTEYRRNHWGTKWDFGKTEYTADEECDWQVDEEGYGLVHLRFDTAWSPPVGWYEALNALDMTVEAYYYEPLMQYYGQWSNPVEGILDEYFTFINKSEIPYTIRMWFINEQDLEDELI